MSSRLRSAPPSSALPLMNTMRIGPARGRSWSEESLPDVQRVVGLDRIFELHGDIGRLAVDDPRCGHASVRSAFGQAARQRNRLLDAHAWLEDVEPRVADLAGDVEALGRRHV